jgi:hypothetical protein
MQQYAPINMCMSDFAHKTNLQIIDTTLKQIIVDHVFSNLKEKDTSSHITSTYPCQQAEFIFFKLPKELNDQILDALPSALKTKDLDPFIRVQYTLGKLETHIDKGRVSGLATVLTDDNTITNFYVWKQNASKILRHELVVEPNEILFVESVTMKKDSTYLFNHASIHDIDVKTIPRITLNILYQHLPYKKLVEIYSNLADQ